MICKHQMHLINQGVHWCELQKDCYPNCDHCPDREEPPEPKIVVSDWLTRGIPPEKLEKEKQKTIKKHERWKRRHPKEILYSALVLIGDLCIDYDGFNTVEGLKSLIDDIHNIQKSTLKDVSFKKKQKMVNIMYKKYRKKRKNQND